MPRKGYGFDSHEKLVDLTDQIVLARFELLDDEPTLVVEERLKGDSPNYVYPPYLLRLRSRTKDIIYNSTDFDGHSEEVFWKQGASRVSAWKSGSCWPIFTFQEGDRYLVFVDSYASVWTAEIVKFKQDKWYSFVKQRVAKSLPNRQPNFKQ